MSTEVIQVIGFFVGCALGSAVLLAVMSIGRRR